MKYLLAALLVLFPTTLYAQGISQLQQFTSTTSPAAAITQTVYGKAFRLSGQGTGCAQFSANGTLTSIGAVCGTGSSSFSYPFPSDATTTALSFNGGATASSLTIGALSGVLKATAGLVSGGASTSDVPEGSNLYFTNARAQSALAGLYEVPLTFSYPLKRTTNTISFIGLATTSPWTAGQLAYVSNGNTLTSAATGTVSSGTGISVTAGQSIIGSGLTITNTGVTSNVAGSGIAVSGATGAVTITNTIGYSFVGDATSTLINFSTGLKSASTTLTGPFVFANATGTNATTTSISSSKASLTGLISSAVQSALCLSASNEVVKCLTPSFLVNKNGTNQTVSSSVKTKMTFTLASTTTTFDTNGNWDAVNNRFTPTVAGKYLFTAQAYCTDNTLFCLGAIYKNGTSVTSAFEYHTGDAFSGAVTIIIDMNGSTDYVEAYVQDFAGTVVSGQTDFTFFSGTLIR